MHGKASGFKLHMTYGTYVKFFYLALNTNGKLGDFFLSFIQCYLRLSIFCCTFCCNYFLKGLQTFMAIQGRISISF